MSRLAPLSLLLLLAGVTSGCAVIAVGSAVVDVASVGVKTVTTVGSLAVDGASAAARAGSGAVKSEPAQEKKKD